MIAMHKEFKPVVNDSSYHCVHVGSTLSNKCFDGCERDDSIDDNISYKNPYYCELTAQYWAWKKSLEVDYIGLVHYRRYFSLPYSRRKQVIIDSESIDKMMMKYDVILPYIMNKPVFGGARLYKHKPNTDMPWVVISDIIQQFYPNIFPSFQKIIYGRRMCYGNMMIMRKDDFDNYSSFLFDVLKKCDESMKENGYEIVPRMDGFLSECLLNVWCAYRFKENRVLRLPVINTELKKSNPKICFISNRINKFLHNIYISLEYLAKFFLKIKR